MHAFFRGIRDEWRPDYPEGTIQLDGSENTLMWRELSDFLADLAGREVMNWPGTNGAQLPSCSEALLSCSAALFNECFKPNKPLTPEQVVGGAGCTLLLEQVVRVITDPGDVVLVPVPFWFMFATIIGKADVKLSPLPASANQSAEQAGSFIPADAAIKEIESLMVWSESTELAWQRHIDELLRQQKRPRALLLTNPQNPLGQCYSRDYLCRLADFCERNELFLLSDEVFALSVHPDTCVPFTSVLSLVSGTDTILKPERVVVLWSASKDFCVSQARVAFAVIPANEALKDALTSFSMSFRISSLADAFFVAFLSPQSLLDSRFRDIVGSGEGTLGGLGHIPRWFVDENSLRLEDAKRRLEARCKRHGIAWLQADAGHFLMLYFGEFLMRVLPENTFVAEDGCALEKKLSAHFLKHGVALRPGSPDNVPRPGWFRVTFSRSTEYMQEAFGRLETALHVDNILETFRRD